MVGGNEIHFYTLYASQIPWESIVSIRIYAWDEFENLSLITHTRGIWILGLDLPVAIIISLPYSILNSFTLPTSLAELGKTLQYPGEDLNAYVKCFYEWELDCYDVVAKDVCIHCMIKDYQACLKNLSFSSFWRLMEARGGPTNLYWGLQGSNQNDAQEATFDHNCREVQGSRRLQFKSRFI